MVDSPTFVIWSPSLIPDVSAGLLSSTAETIGGIKGLIPKLDKTLWSNSEFSQFFISTDLEIS